MKPFSLEWWLDMHRTSSSILNWYIRTQGFNKDARYYNKLHLWIEQRIINKYSKQH